MDFEAKIPSVAPKPSALVRIGRWVFRRRLFVAIPAVLIAVLVLRPEPAVGPYRLPITAASALLVLAGVGMRVWAGGSAGNHTRRHKIEAPQLATGGPYAYVRNPIYLGSVLLGVGMVGLVGDFRLLALAVPVFAGLYATMIPAEEEFLLFRFGDDYRDYCRAVPRLLPRLRPWPGRAVQPFDWGVLRREATFVFCLVVIYGAVALSAHWR